MWWIRVSVAKSYRILCSQMAFSGNAWHSCSIRGSSRLCWGLPPFGVIAASRRQTLYALGASASIENQTSYSFAYACADQTTIFELPARYALSSLWMSLFFLSVAVMIAAALVPLVLRRRRMGPDILGSVVSLTRDSPYFRGVPRGPSTESSTDKAFRMRRVRVKLRDVHLSELENHQGVIAFAPEERVGPVLKKKKVYT